jgi:hypothetical protein
VVVASVAGRGLFNQGAVLEAGIYTVKLSVGGKEHTTRVVVEPDPGINYSMTLAITHFR